MSEASDDSQLPANDEVVVPPVVDTHSDADDVEVLAHPPEAEAALSAPRHDSVAPTSRKLAPPPKPKRDSSQPASSPPPAGDGLQLGSLRAPSAPAISYQEVSESGRPAFDAVPSSDPLRAIGEALAHDVGAFSTNEQPTGIPRPQVPRPRAAGADAPEGTLPEPAASVADGARAPTLPEDAPSTLTPRPASIFAQRIISVGTPSDRPPRPLSEPPPAVVASPPAPLPVAQPAPVTVAQPAPLPVAQPALPVALVTPGLAAPAAEPVAAPSDRPPLVASEPQSLTTPSARPLGGAPEPQPLAVPPERPGFPISERPRAAPPRPSPPPPTPESESSADAPLEGREKRPSVPPLPAVIAVGIATIDIDIDEAPPEIPITTDFDDETPTHPSASPTPLPAPVEVVVDAAPPVVPVIPDEPTPPPPVVASADAVARAEPLAPEDVAPDSLERVPVEELSREDSPSVPPEEPTPIMPPPAPSGRAEAKAPPQPPPQPPPPPRRPALASDAATPGASEARDATTPEGEKKKSKNKRPWWEELFSEDFVRANWKVSDEQIKREVNFVEESLGVAPGGIVLDLGCGSGQHAVELASRGYGVVGYDLSLYQLALAADIAQERSQKINFLQGDMREMAFEEMFDGIYCWNTSFGYFEEDKNFSVAERAFRALRPGGMFLIDVMNRDFVAAHTPSSVWFEGDACVCMDDAVIDYFTSRLRVKRSVILDDGRTRECTYSVRLYSFHELGKLLHEVGFRVTEVSGHPATPGVFLGQASPRILMLAQRP